MSLVICKESQVEAWKELHGSSWKLGLDFSELVLAPFLHRHKCQDPDEESPSLLRLFALSKLVIVSKFGRAILSLIFRISLLPYHAGRDVSTKE